MMYATQQDTSQPNSFLIGLAIKAISRAQDVSLTELISRQESNATDYPDLWPGEHYRLLAALVAVLQPIVVVEIGSYQGLSALSLTKFLPSKCRVTTFDVVPWDQCPDTCLTPDDFADGRLVQQIGDLSQPHVFELHKALLSDAQVIFLDAPKDGIFERKFLQLLATLKDSVPKLLIFDDIRTWNMLAIWREIPFPKLDLTSFGHWTGTGLVDWKPNAKS
jgi:hypothetical protein